MKRFGTFILAAVALAGCSRQAGDIAGTLTIYNDFSSKYVEARNLRIWTPEDYDSAKKYDVIYMHDGQNLFDATITWNNQEWGVDECLSRLIKAGEIRPCIVVGIDNSPLRYEEYYPSEICGHIAAGTLPEGFRPLGDEYLRFVVEEVKPFVDSLYSTWTDASHTFVMGSSCGGLISSYALCEYPEVFGGAACLSTHSSLTNPYTDIDQKPAAEAYLKYLRENLPADDSHILYMDRGDCPYDSTYAETQDAINDMIDSLGWESSHHMYRLFPGHSHSEKDWQARLDISVKYLLKH